jgi:hypothetical protein
MAIRHHVKGLKGALGWALAAIALAYVFGVAAAGIIFA